MSQPQPQPKPSVPASKVTPLQGVKGMNDVLPPTSRAWLWLEREVAEMMHLYGFEPVRTPILEPTPLFVRSIGEVTDIVEKEMYSFEDRMNGEALTLRPENTAGIARASIEHNLLYEGGRRLWYFGPMFRHERPQRGRFRQFHQIGAEALGFSGPDVDAELLLLTRDLWARLGLASVALELNCLGAPPERAAHRQALIDYLERHHDALDEEARRRLHSNPLRVLDSKNPAMQALLNEAPQLLGYLGSASRAHFDGLQAMLSDHGVAYRINPRLVRGLDYYNLTVFEWVTDQLGSQGTICGGGRYDYLFEQLGGKPTPACGWSIGVERLLELLSAKPNPALAALDPLVYVVVQDPALTAQALRISSSLRAQGIAVLQDAAHTSMKSQMKKASASGAAWAVIVAPQEMERQCVTLKQLSGNAFGGAQEVVPIAELANKIAA